MLSFLIYPLFFNPSEHNVWRESNIYFQEDAKLLAKLKKQKNVIGECKTFVRDCKILDNFWTNFDLMMVLDDKSEDQISEIHPLGTINVCTTFCAILSSRYGDML